MSDDKMIEQAAMVAFSRRQITIPAWVNRHKVEYPTLRRRKREPMKVSFDAAVSIGAAVAMAILAINEVAITILGGM